MEAVLLRHRMSAPWRLWRHGAEPRSPVAVRLSLHVLPQDLCRKSSVAFAVPRKVVKEILYT